MSTLKINTLSNVAGSQSISTDRVAQGTAFAWVNFNGTGTVAIRASYNVSSITDNGGAGAYTVNFASAAPDANYAAVALPQVAGTVYSISTTTAGFQIQVVNTGFASADAAVVSVVAFR